LTEAAVVLSVVGARPQFVKSAALCRAFDHANAGGADLRHILVHTGQHYDFEMSQIFFDDLSLPAPDVHLGVGSASHGRQTGEMLAGLEAVIAAERPHFVVVFGDTNSTLAGALAAAKLRVSVAHVEAGMRSGRRDMPEEINRLVADHLSELLFCPTDTAADALAHEGITDGVVVSGDLMFEVLHDHLPVAESRKSLLDELHLERQSYALATVHRAANTDDAARLMMIGNALERVAEEFPVVFPVHPRTRAALGEHVGLRGVTVIDPVGYLDMVCLETQARVIVTDSGGVQKEALWLSVPCVTLRAETEWPETLEGGWNILTDVDADAIAAAARRPRPSVRPSEALNLRGASDRIVTALIEQREKLRSA
jgi:UDP-GlcNAc3NAcA epimerase